ncbi:hypothetical protein OSTOST_23006, partial [Ostertagia ostertagi]
SYKSIYKARESTLFETSLTCRRTIRIRGTPPGDQLGQLLEQAVNLVPKKFLDIPGVTAVRVLELGGEYSCANDYQIQSGEAGVMFVFTNIPCEELCQSEQLLTDAQPITQIFTLSLGYVVKYMFLSDDASEKGTSNMKNTNS